MAKHWFESWLTEQHAWLTALMSSLRFDDVANKRTLLIIWPLTSSVTTTNTSHPHPHSPNLQLFLFGVHFTPPSLHWPSLVTTWKWGHACVNTNKGVHPQGQSTLEKIQCVILSPLGTTRWRRNDFNVTDYMAHRLQKGLRIWMPHKQSTVFFKKLYQVKALVKKNTHTHKKKKKTSVQVVITCPFRQWK